MHEHTGFYLFIYLLHKSYTQYSEKEEI